mmetsp:Transcript_1250/g.2123  ORF Transcript_1250/g.2123 Transcript_1250/m.2123 type:complete len:243 (-) Transcript_1250:736-1464(-)
MQQALLISSLINRPTFTSLTVVLLFQNRHKLELAGGGCGQHGGAAEESSGHLHLGQENAENDDVQGNPEDVVNCRALALWDNFALKRAHCGKIHPDAALKNQEANENQIVACRYHRDKKAERGDYEGVLGNFLNRQRFREDSEKGASRHACHHEGGEDEAEREGFIFPSGGLKGGGPHEDESEHAPFKQRGYHPAEENRRVVNDGVEAFFQNLYSIIGSNTSPRAMSKVFTPIILNIGTSKG